MTEFISSNAELYKRTPISETILGKITSGYAGKTPTQALIKKSQDDARGILEANKNKTPDDRFIERIIAKGFDSTP